MYIIMSSAELSRSMTSILLSVRMLYQGGKMYIIMSSAELSRSMTSILLSVQSGSILTDQGQGYG